jgi:hypothetical protein
MKSVTERKRLRREYLWKRARSGAWEAIGFLLFLPLMLLATSFGIITLFLVAWCVLGVGNDCMLWIMLATLVSAGLTLVFGWGACISDKIMIRANSAGRIPYIPPVTPDTFPADEILVRGAEEPSDAQSEALLRAAAGQETPKEELVRAIISPDCDRDQTEPSAPAGSTAGAPLDERMRSAGRDERVCPHRMDSASHATRSRPERVDPVGFASDPNTPGPPFESGLTA